MIVEADPVADQAAPRLVPVRTEDLETGDVVLVGDHRLIVEGLADLASGFCRVLLSDGSRHERAPDELWEVCRGAA